MAAYDNADWAEFYDLWVLQLFGDRRSQESELIASVLLGILETRTVEGPPGPGGGLGDVGQAIHLEPSERIAVVDIGAGTGRVVVQLIRSILAANLHVDQHATPPRSRAEFFFVAVEPSEHMILRAMDAVNSAKTELVLPKRGNSNSVPLKYDLLVSKQVQQPLPNISVRNCRKALSRFLPYSLPGASVILSKRGEIDGFFFSISEVLHPGGKAVISVLHEMLAETDGGSEMSKDDAVDREYPVTTQSDRNTDSTTQTVRLTGTGTSDELRFVRSRLSELWDKDVRIDRFRLDVESVETSKILRSHTLEWNLRRIDVQEWESAVERAGMEIDRRVQGEIQDWWILKR